MTTLATTLRRTIHAHPDLSGHEQDTANRLRNYFCDLGLGHMIEPLGGTGLAVIIAGTQAGPTIMLRAELDALPIKEDNDFAHRSSKPGISHKCGHDGHMAILAEVGRRLAEQPPGAGSVILLFQPAEETGKGALDVLADPRFEDIKPDQIYALHNLPEVPLGYVVTRPGTFSCASRGMHIHLHGLETHAAQPEKGISPSRAVRDLISALEGPGNARSVGAGLTFATVVHVSMGSKSFGIAPGSADIMATLRSEHDADMAAMIEEIENKLSVICKREKLEYSTSFDDIFPATVNDDHAFARICAVVPAENLVVPDKPFRWSEDFGHFTARCPGAIFGLGAGTKTPALHHPAYDFPDELIDIGADLFVRLIRGETDN